MHGEHQSINYLIYMYYMRFCFTGTAKGKSDVAKYMGLINDDLPGLLKWKAKK